MRSPQGHDLGPDEYLARLKQSAAQHDGEPVTVDLRPVAAMSQADAVMVSNGLLGSLGDVPLDIDPLPATELPRLARGGVYFALANRSGATGLSRAPLPMQELDAWRESWSPGATQPIRELFSAEQLSETEYVPRLFGPYHAAFVQPHLAAAVRGGTEVTRVLRPWLLRILPGKKASLDARFVADVGRLVEELVENVREHAPRQLDGRPTCSLVDVSVTRGGHGTRLHISVQDTGPGIVATARAKVEPRLASVNPAELVIALLRGEAGSWQRARGLGLPRVWDAVREQTGGRLSIATGLARVEGADGALEGSVSNFDLSGTVVHATWRVP